MLNRILDKPQMERSRSKALAIADELNAGAVITFSRNRIRVRRLPIVRET